MHFFRRDESRLYLIVLLQFSTLLSFSQNAVYKFPDVSEEQLIRACNPFLALSEKELLALVPVQGGFRFCGSPESLAGAQENNMIWKLAYGDKVQCQFTKTFFPNPDYPENGFLDFETPSGKIQRFKYHQAADGKKYWFEGRKWYEQRILLERAAYQLAQLYTLSPGKHVKAGRYAGLILKQFASVYPDYIISFDYPGREKQFYTSQTYPGEVISRKHDAWRLAKWSWWAYMDVSENLLLTYDLLRNHTILTKEEQSVVENDLFRPMLQFVDRYAHIATTNMHPTLWRAQAAAANILDIPALIDSVNNGISRMLKEQFTHDGFWKETTVSYHRQTASGLLNVFNRLYPGLEDAAKTAKMRQLHPGLFQASTATDAFRLPNGHYASVNDTWSRDSYQPLIEESVPHLKTGIGYGVLGMGKGNRQLQAHLNFNGHFGHDHYAGLNLTLFGKGKELASDLGYTHTKARTWATSTTAHNLVVVNGKSQRRGTPPYSGKGNILLFNGTDPGFQAIEADATDSYRGEGISRYSRMLVAIEGTSNDQYVVDIFNVAGPGQKDWILHGSADEAQEILADSPDGSPLSWTDRPSLLPEGQTFKTIENLSDFKLLWEPYWAHGNFRNVRQSQVTTPFKSTFRYTENPAKGLQTWFPSNRNSTVSTAKSWSIRNARENQQDLDLYLRSSVIVSRQDSLARFSAVHVPFEGEPFVRKVETLYEDERAVVLKIRLADGITDYIICQTGDRELSVNLDGQALLFDGRVGFLRIGEQQVTLKMIDGNRLSFGAHTLSGARFSSPLLAVRGNQLVVEGNFSAAPGEILIIQHGNGHTTSFHVESAVYNANRTIITTQEPPVYELRDDHLLDMKVFPFFSYPGSHTLRSSRLVKASFSR